MSNAKKEKVIFRADGNETIGLGHVFRLLALASMLRENFTCVFAIKCPSNEIKNGILSICDELVELPFSDSSNQELAPFIAGNEIVVLDGYSFTTEYQVFLKNKGCRVVCIDDIYAYHFVADVVINHAVGIVRDFYSVEPYTQCYFGPKYLLLREPFLNREGNDEKTFTNIFVNMGGADPHNDTCRVLKEILNFSQFAQVHVVIGSAFSHTEELNALVKSEEKVVLHRNLNAAQLVKLMESCGVAVCPPSTVSLEYATVGGVLFLKQIADNQKDIKKFLLKENLAYDYDTQFSEVIENFNDSAFREVIQNQAAVFDGRSDSRLRAIFDNLSLTDVNL